MFLSLIPENSIMLVALILFIATYACLLIFAKYRSYIALASAAIFVILGILPINKLLGSLDYNVLMMIAGTMGIVSLFIESKMPSLLADLILEKVPNVKWAVISLALFAGIVSAFIDNVATVLMIAPVALNISKKLKISPVPSLIAISISSNLQGAATLVGDTTSIMLSSKDYANMDFLDFFWFKGHIGLFFIVQIGAIVSTLVLLYFFRKDTEKVEAPERTKVQDYFPTILLGLMVILLISASFIPNKPDETNGYIVMGLLLVGLIYKLIRTKNFKSLLSNVQEIDYFTLLLLAGLFIVIAAISEAGLILKISEIISNLGNNNVFLVYTIIVWASVLFSAFIDNIPYVATMLPVVGAISLNLGLDAPYVLYFGLLIGATLGGNLTPIGASANITTLGILRKEGYEVKAKQFMKLSVPFTLAAVTTGYLLIWLIWGM